MDIFFQILLIILTSIKNSTVQWQPIFLINRFSLILMVHSNLKSTNMLKSSNRSIIMRLIAKIFSILIRNKLSAIIYKAKVILILFEITNRNWRM